ncbi:E3 ubiquitin-protein ligase RMA1H1-like [Macadamia integrifolia]|uniref:E3 ubiquitin-protein ligase RMA1H1-like n=1 Tax=Macadamia integrifolia TaxID=60698 RepID=UPI001C530AB2|nr:E3 ubiquitin-protein ligase RMA1H1-like [Macadamia integrifolia]XP_042520722.1 E3 ubiquitin-protein ligase RMA1H1-like [Macadamia integrifolia]
MAIEQYFQEAVAQHEMGDDDTQLRKWKSGSDAATASGDNTGCFDCNICLDHAQNPVVTLCGHLFCWPCIYKWVHFQSASTEQHQCCPVCKADVSLTTLVPLYGRGHPPKEAESEGKGSQIGLDIPQRPSPCGVHALISTTSTSSSSGRQPHRNPYQSQPHVHQHQHQQYRNYATTSTPLMHLSANVYHPIVGMLGEMIYARVFGNSQTNLYAYPNSYNLMGSSNPRLRRQEKQAEKSLNRISIFLFCCLVLCLLLF